MAGHCCQKGHVVHCMEGSFDSELASGKIFTLNKGESYVSDDVATSKKGVKLLIIDGDFLSDYHGRF